MISKEIFIPDLDIDNLPPATEHVAAIDPRGIIGRRADLAETMARACIERRFNGRVPWENFPDQVRAIEVEGAKAALAAIEAMGFDIIVPIPLPHVEPGGTQSSP